MSKHADAFNALATEKGYQLSANQPLPWLTPKAHTVPDVAAKLPKSVLDALDRMLDALDGDRAVLAAKTRGHCRADFVLPDGREVEHDEVQHFTSARLTTLGLYPPEIYLGFDLNEYRTWCEQWRDEGERGFAHKRATEFPGDGGRMRQRAFLDAFRDLAAPTFGNGPVLRIHAPENDATLAL